jgi:hypothetical protein
MGPGPVLAQGRLVRVAVKISHRLARDLTGQDVIARDLTGQYSATRYDSDPC